MAEDGPTCELTCSDDQWERWLDLVKLVTETPVVYGPGRGLWVDGQWVITWGPGKLGRKKWKAKGKRGPSFHCSSWTNFVCGFLTGANQDYTHSGNIPALQDVLDEDETLHHQRKGVQAAKWRGYGGHTTELLAGKVVTLQDILDNIASLPTFLVVAQSTKKKGGGWKWWHHTVVFVVDRHGTDTPTLWRIAADGYKGNKGFSCKPMQYRQMTPELVASDTKKHIYQGSCVYAEGVPATVIVEV